jgi:PAS domain S-box-containing protein
MAVLFVGVLAVMLPPAARAIDAVVPKRILVLYWYNREWPGNVTFHENFQAALESATTRPVEYYSEYLESNRFPGEDQSLLLRNYLRQKYADRTIDVVVAVTDASVEFLLKYRDSLFTSTPIVFIAAKAPVSKKVVGRAGLTGIVLGGDYTNTLDLALRLHPNTERVFIISGTLERDQRYERLCREEFRQYEGRVSIDYLTDLAPDELISRTRHLPKDSIVLYVFQQILDEHGKTLESPDILALIANSTPCPIYGLSNWQVGRGIVGGFVRTLDANGARAAEIALRIVNGMRAQDIPVESTPVVPTFDWRELKRWRISEQTLPFGSRVLFRVPSFWDEYKWYATVLICVVIGQSVLIAGLITNRAQRKRAEEERRRAQFDVAESRARLAGVVGSAMDAIISVDDDQRIVLLNDAAEKMFGCVEHEVIGEPLERFIPERFREAHRQYIQAFGDSNATRRSMRSGGAVYGRRANGEEFPIEASISQLELHGKRFYTVILRDITQRHKAVEALRESEERFRNMADTAPVMIWVADVDKRCTYFNQQWLDFTGRTMEEEICTGWAGHISTDDAERCLETYTTAFDLHRPFTIEYRLRRQDGQFRWILDSGTARFSPGGEFLGYIGSCLDITERKAAEQALQDLSGQLIRAREEECARIARELHDDVNQRMALVSIELDELQQNPPDTTEKLRARLKDVMTQITDTSREIHRMSYDLHPSKLVQLGLVAALKSLCHELHQRHGLIIEFTESNVPAELPRDISLCIYRIVQECLSNIIRHSGAKESHVELVGTGNELRLRVNDSGIGFDSESPGAKQGLGLVSMRERLRLVGGDISVDSRSSSGTQINASVPMAMGNDVRRGDGTRMAARR